jgi:Lrp/AsnC family transcriptional regulator, leucine-responsive regulatory protein
VRTQQTGPAEPIDQLRRIIQRRLFTKDRWRQASLVSRHVAPEAAGLNLLAFIMVGWSNPKVEAIFLEKVKASPDVLECHHVTGAWNHLLKVRVGTTRDLERFLTETIKAVNGVERTETPITLSSAKETWKVSLKAAQF